MKGYGYKLRELRGKRSREETARAVGVSVSPRDEIKLRLADFFGKTVQEIFFT